MTFTLFFFNDTPTTEIYTLSLHDALPISCAKKLAADHMGSHAVFPLDERVYQLMAQGFASGTALCQGSPDRKSTRLNSSHPSISYAVFCLKKKKNTTPYRTKLPPDSLSSS